MKTLLLSLVILCFIASPVYSQTALKVLPDPLNSPVCPLSDRYHSVVPEGTGSRPACTYTWTVTGGTIAGGSTGVGTGVYVKWNDSPGFGQNFPSGTCNNSVDYSVCSNF